MKQLEIRVFENTNIPFLAQMIEKLKVIGCEIIEDKDTITIKYDESLDSKLSELFNKLI